MFFKLLIILLALVACQPLVTATPPPTPQTIQVQISPALLPWREALYACAQEMPLVALVVEEVPTASLDIRQADLVLRLSGLGDLQGPAVILGAEQLVVVVHPENPVEAIQLEKLTALFSGEINAWDELQPGGVGSGPGQNPAVRIWNYPENEDLRVSFEGVVLEAGETPAPYHLAPGPAAMLQAIAEDPAAIGYLPESWVDETVKIVQVDENLGAKLKLPVLGLTSDEPQGLLRQLMGCIQ